MNRVKTLIRRLTTLSNCECGSASVYQTADGRNHCMDCGRTW